MRNRSLLLRAVIMFAVVMGATFLVSVWQLRGLRHQSNLPSAKTAHKSTFPEDDLGRKINLQKPAQRVAVIGPGATETIFSLGLGSHLVGRDQYSNYPPAVLKIPIIGNYTGPFYEKIIAAHPDLVILQGETWDYARVQDFQQKTGVAVAALTATNLREVARDFRKMGAWLGATKKADALAAKLQDLIKISPPQTISAFVEIGRSPLWAAGKGTLVSDVLAHCGFRNVADVKGYKQFGVESLLALHPQVYIVPVKNPGVKTRRKVLSTLQKNTQLSALGAIKKGHVIVVDNDALLRPGPRLVQSIKALRKKRKEWK